MLAEQSLPPGSPSLSKMLPVLREQACILNVNDNAAALYLTTLTLRRAGYEVLEASTGVQALELARQGPDLVLLDVRLPDLSGHEVCALLKANPGTSSIVVLQTSAADVDGTARAAGLMRRSLPITGAEQLQSRLATIERSARRMNHLIQDLLDLARFQAGTLVGRLSVESQPGQGTIFTFALPHRPSPAP